MKVNKKRALLWGYVASSLVLSASFLLMPLDLITSSVRRSSLVAGILFWVSLAATLITAGWLARIYRRWRSKLPDAVSSGLPKLPGIIRFFRNPLALAADIVMLISLIGLIASLIATDASGYICYIFIALFVFSFCMHCMLNGKIYYSLTHRNTSAKSNAAAVAEDLSKGAEKHE